MSELPLPDFPKLYAPLVREKGKFVRPFRVADGFEWVFEQTFVTAVEKLDGTNVCTLRDSAGALVRVQNRKQLIWSLENLEINNENSLRLLMAAHNSFPGAIRRAGQVFGEVVGPKINKNRHKLAKATFVPFEYAALFLSEDVRMIGPEDIERFLLKQVPWFAHHCAALGLVPPGTMYVPEGAVLYGQQKGQICKIRKDML